MMAQRSDESVQVWHYPLDLDAGVEARCAQLLDGAELERARRFRFDIHRRRFIIGRGTLRMILAGHADCAPQAIGFAHGEHGKPCLAEPVGSVGLKFSVSNCEDLGAVAIAWQRELGLDVERVRPDFDHEMIASREFSAQERSWFQSLPEAERPAAFFELWICKEAYLKGKGVGLGAALNRFTIALPADAPPQLVWSDLDAADAQRWHLSRVSTEPGYLACLAQDGQRHAIQSAPWHIDA